MPYIASFIDEVSGEDRAHIDQCLTDFASTDFPDLAEIIRTVPSGKIKGAFNYFCCRLWLNTFFPDHKIGYTSLSDAQGVFMDMLLEMNRRLMIPYEDKAIEKNGDLPEITKIKEVMGL